ncbi:hypothetical protein C4F51_05035 [Cellvibrio sp. KB43]|uniref:Uncharacterized protein n=1 Tax=Cellvibrio polysaccharolyticus TaxID=2082724 RepID=A0A928V0G2_9GAMM|nr:hypothetical protein [Cellvibrio polysaccharolyticus]
MRTKTAGLAYLQTGQVSVGWPQGSCALVLVATRHQSGSSLATAPIVLTGATTMTVAAPVQRTGFASVLVAAVTVLLRAEIKDTGYER